MCGEILEVSLEQHAHVSTNQEFSREGSSASGSCLTSSACKGSCDSTAAKHLEKESEALHNLRRQQVKTAKLRPLN